jgi:hypothetical protein
MLMHRSPLQDTVPLFAIGHSVMCTMRAFMTFEAEDIHIATRELQRTEVLHHSL